MDDKKGLLSRLRIDRGPEVRQAAPRSRWWAIGGAVTLGLIAIGLWREYENRSVIAVHVVTAKAVATNTGKSTGTLLDASGYVVARRQATVSSKITGRLAEVLVEEGQRIEEGQIIARLEDSTTRIAVEQANGQLAQAQANFEAGRVALENAKPIFRRTQQLFAKKAISAEEFERAKASYDASDADYKVRQQSLALARINLRPVQQNQEDTIVRSPFAGIVTVKAAQPGEIVAPGSAGGGYTRTGICTVVDMDSLEVEVDVNESFFGRLHVGQPVNVKLDAFPDDQIPGELLAVIPTVNRATATIKARVGFKRKTPSILPEMSARVSFLESATPAGLGSEIAPSLGVVIPVEAVRSNGSMGVLFFVRGDTIEQRTVQLGARRKKDQIVLSGLSPGDRLVANAQSDLDDGRRIRIVD